jgi:transcription initiation factor TFIIIB Brf1 subunit/transcription initiation factor TFIIB
MTIPSSSTVCPFCGSSAIRRVNETELLCSDCSFVVSGPEEIPAEKEKLNSQSQSSTVTETTAEGWQDSIDVRDSSDSVLVEMIATAEEFVRGLGGDTDDCIKTAEMLAEVWQNQYFRGRSASVGIAAVIYANFRQQKSPRPLGIVAETCGISDQQLRTGYRALRRDFNVHSEITPPASYLPFLRSQLDLNKAAEKRARELLSIQSEYSGSPTSIASACIYLAAKEQGESTTLAETGAACGVTKETVWRKTQKITN